MDIDECIKKYESWKVSIMPLFPRTKQPCLSSWSHLILERAPLDQIWKWKETYWNTAFWREVWEGKKNPQLKERWVKALKEDWNKAGVADQLEKYSYDDTLGVAVIGSPKASDGLVLVDIEDVSLLPDADQAAIKGDAWKTPVVKTGRQDGHHVYLKFPPGKAENRKKPNGEIRAFGQYVAAPPTVHPNGTQYQFIKDFKIMQIKEDEAADLMEHLTKLISATQDKVLEFARKIPVEAGKRSDWIVALTAYYKMQGRAEKEVYDLLLTIPICADKLEDNGFGWWKEYEWDYLDGSMENGVGGLMHAASEQSCIPLSPELKKEIKKVDSEAQGGITLEDVCIPVMDDKGEKVKDMRFSPTLATGAILKKFKIITTDDDTEWIYRDGIYVPRGTATVDKILDRVCGDKYNINASREVHKKIRTRTMAETRPFDPDPFKFGAANAIVDLRTGICEPYTPELLITLRSPVVYDPEATCPAILEFLRSSLGNDEAVKTVIDIFVAAACAVPFEFFVCLVGVGSNGKKILEVLLERFFGSDQITACRIDELGTNPFIRGDLMGKRVLINSEVTGDKRESNWIKAISSGDTIDSDRKNKARVKFNPFCIIVFDTNNPPKFHDNSNGFIRRFIKLDFPYVFTDSPDKNNPKEKKRDPDLVKKITSQQEMSGLLNLIIKRAPEIIKRREIYRSKTGSQMLAEYDRQTYSISTFIEEFCDTTLQSTFISSEDLYNQYKLYCAGINAAPKHMVPFLKSVVKLPTVKKVNQSVETNGKRGYSGIIVKKKELDEFILKLNSTSSFKSGESGDIRLNQVNTDTASGNQDNDIISSYEKEKVPKKYSDKKCKNPDLPDLSDADSGLEPIRKSGSDSTEADNGSDFAAVAVSDVAKTGKIERETPMSIRTAAWLEWGQYGQADPRKIASKLTIPVDEVIQFFESEGSGYVKTATGLCYTQKGLKHNHDHQNQKQEE